MLQEIISTAPVVVEKVNVRPMRILYISGTVPMAGLTQFFSDAFGEIFRFIGPNHTHPGKAMAFYENIKDPIGVQAAVEVDTIPFHLPGKLQTRIVNGGEALLCHYQGEYKGLRDAYRVMKDWLVKNNKKAMGMPFEVYLNNPASTTKREALRTDIYQFMR